VSRGRVMKGSTLDPLQMKHPSISLHAAVGPVTGATASTGRAQRPANISSGRQPTPTADDDTKDVKWMQRNTDVTDETDRVMTVDDEQTSQEVDESIFPALGRPAPIGSLSESTDPHLSAGSVNRSSTHLQPTSPPRPGP